jgi:exopolysaccharide biosynthesis polyprenyl glycosylphosphotransferase
MLNYRRKILLELFKGVDLLIMSACMFIGALAVSFIDATEFGSFLSMRIKLSNLLISILLLLAWHAIYRSFGLYNSRRLSPKLAEVSDVIKATSLGTLMVFIASLVFNISIITPFFLLVFWSSVTGVSIISRLLGRLALARIRTKGRNLRYMLIVGTNPRVLRFARKIEANPQLGYKIIGFMDDEWPGVNQVQAGGYHWVGRLDELPDFLRNHVVEEVVIGLPIKSMYDRIVNLAQQCEKQGIIIRFLSDIFNRELALSEAERSGEENLVSFYTGKLRGWPVFLKRVMDFSLSLISIILSFPIFILIGLAIKFTSPGPICFIQERLGLYKRRFRLYKFRTMVADAEQKLRELEHLNEVDGPAFKIKNDPRVTPLGRFLRKTSLDELPQLINVLQGNMSLVGPRPLPVRDYSGFTEDWQRRRFSVRPGITCLWQINGRSNTSFEIWMEQDMEYIDNWSLWLDLRILLKTIPAVLSRSGAA